MQADLCVVYGQCRRDKSLYCATFELYQVHEWTGVSLCESVTTLTASVLIQNEAITQVAIAAGDDGDGCPIGMLTI